MEQFEFGEILKGDKTNHPIIFLWSESEDKFHGCIITHAEHYENNFPLRNEHFLETDSQGKPYPVQYDNSFYARLKLEKRKDWGPYEKAGQLSPTGIKYIQNQVQSLHPIRWKEYIKSSK